MGRTKGDAGAYEFTRAAYDEVADAAHKWRVGFAVAMLPSESRGVWQLVIEAYSMERSALAAPIASWSGLWPNSVSQSFEAFLYAAAHRVVRMVEQWHENEPDIGRGLDI